MKNISKWVRPNIRDLKPYSSARSEFEGSASTFLDANENPFENGYNRYPDPLQWKLKKTIARRKNVKPEQLFLGNGSDEAIDLLMRIFCEPRQDAIVTLPPTYGMYQVSAAISDIQVKEVPLQANFEIDTAAVLAVANAQTKLLFVCSPNNPTGHSIAPKVLKTLLENFEGIVVVDEAYIDFAEQASFLSWIDKYPNLVVLQTFSKAWGLAGIRLGMAFANAQIIDFFNKVKPPYNVNVLTQKAALKALETAEKTEQRIQEILSERKKLATALKDFSFVEKVYPSDANFLLVKVVEPQQLYDFLVSRGIIVRNRSTLNGCEGCLRITIGTKNENRDLLRALESWKPSGVVSE